MNILNLYSGIGGNRRLWGDDHNITSVEYREDIAAVYRHYFPKDRVITADAHKFLLENYYDYDIIWTSRPCTTHSRANFWASRNVDNRKKYYPDFGLYEEIAFLKYWFDGLWIAENVIPYYDNKEFKHLFQPDYTIGRHLFWCNFKIDPFESIDSNIHKGTKEEWSKILGFDLSNFKIDTRKDQIYRNCVHPETGLHILNCALNKITHDKIKQGELF